MARADSDMWPESLETLLRGCMLHSPWLHAVAKSDWTALLHTMFSDPVSELPSFMSNTWKLLRVVVETGVLSKQTLIMIALVVKERGVMVLPVSHEDAERKCLSYSPELSHVELENLCQDMMQLLCALLHAARLLNDEALAKNMYDLLADSTPLWPCFLSYCNPGHTEVSYALRCKALECAKQLIS
eukprot:4514950-Ditylum_brightwellii.AAC.1